MLDPEQVAGRHFLSLPMGNPVVGKTSRGPRIKDGVRQPSQPGFDIAICDLKDWFRLR
jgi:hypothetical protein